MMLGERCFSDSFGMGDGFCLSEDYNKMVCPFHEDGMVRVDFHELILTDVFAFNNQEDKITIGLYMILTWTDYKIEYSDETRFLTPTRKSLKSG